MHYQNEPAQEFAHIRAMVLLLEQLVQRESSGLRATAVTSPEYWRARLKAAVKLPTELQPQVPIDSDLSASCRGRIPDEQACWRERA